MNQNANSVRQAAIARRRAMAAGGKAVVKSGNQSATTPPPQEPVRASKTRSPSRNTRNTRVIQSQSLVVESNARAASKARRKMMSTAGKTAAVSGGRIVTSDRKTDAMKSKNASATAAASTNNTATEESGCGCGCGGKKAECKSEIRRGSVDSKRHAKNRATARIRAAARTVKAHSAGRAASMARRSSMSVRGKAGIGSQGLTPAQTARAANPSISSRELARSLREQRSRTGKAGQKSSDSSGQRRKRRSLQESRSQDAPWKVGASETSQGQVLTGTMVGRSEKVSGDEQSTCRSITGTEYMGADVFREFCQTEPVPTPSRGGVSQTELGLSVSGNKVGRSERVTGDESGSCKNVTGDQYIGTEMFQQFCDAAPSNKPAEITSASTRNSNAVSGTSVSRSERVTGGDVGSDRQLTGSQYLTAGEIAQPKPAPAKVGVSQTLNGGGLTGTQVGRSERVTGDEQGSCKHVTGDDYLGSEQFQKFCESVPKASDQKVGVSNTLKGESVTGTMTGRSGRVTGDEPGTCKAVTGTPYAGMEQAQAYCKPESVNAIQARVQPANRTGGAAMTGIQPGMGGVMTGASKGQCDTPTGTPYVGADQVAEACEVAPVKPLASDFPQSLAAASGSVNAGVPAPVQAVAVADQSNGSVTGTRYEQQKHITGAFDKAGGRVTGTEEFRFGRDNRAVNTAVMTAPGQSDSEQPKASRVTGEGNGGNITGDDWDRGDRVTGTEGKSATRRNPTRRGSLMEGMMQSKLVNQTHEAEVPVSLVTGGSGNTEKGSLVTYSGGARG